MVIDVFILLPKKYKIFPKSIRVHSPTFNCTLVFINGHLPARNFTQNALIIGTIREPYARMASAYSYLRDGAHSWEDWDVKTKNPSGYSDGVWKYG